MNRNPVEILRTLPESRQDIIEALEEKKVIADSNLKVSEVADYIRQIEVGGKSDVYLCKGALFNTSISSLNSSPTSIIFTRKLPPEGVRTVNLGVSEYEDSANPYKDTIIAWEDTIKGKIYVSGRGNIIIANKSCSSMFSGFSDLTTLDLALLDTSKTTDMSYMFQGTGNLELDFSILDTSSATTMANMFLSWKGNTQELILPFDTSNVVNMESMFQYSTSLTSIDLKTFKTEQLTSITSMFNGCTNLINIYAFDWTSNSKITSSLRVFTGDTKLPNYNSMSSSGANCKPSTLNGYFTQPNIIATTFDYKTSRPYITERIENIRDTTKTIDITQYFDIYPENATIAFKYNPPTDIWDLAPQSVNYDDSTKIVSVHYETRGTVSPDIESRCTLEFSNDNRTLYIDFNYTW